MIVQERIKELKIIFFFIVFVKINFKNGEIIISYEILSDTHMFP